MLTTRAKPKSPGLMMRVGGAEYSGGAASMALSTKTTSFT